MRINQEIGCIYDTLMFLSAWINETTGNIAEMNNDLSAYYNDVKQSIKQNTELPRYLYPFLYRNGEAESFLFSLIFNREYSKCNFDLLRYTLTNKLFIKMSFLSHYIPNVKDQTIRDVVKMENSNNVIEALAKRSTDRNTDTYLFYIFANFDNVIQALYDVVHSVYSQMETLRKFILPDFITKTLKKETVYKKLRAITNANVLNESDFTVSVSLMKTDILSYRTDERNFILLGYDFEKRLESEYKYCDVSLYSFAQAIASNPLKYDIFTALSNQSPLTAADLSMRLNTGRSALDYNISEMVKSKILTIEPINKRTYSYNINKEYLQIISRQLNHFQ